MTAFTYTKPTVGGSEDTWGTTLNANWDALGAFLGSLDSAELAVLDGITSTTAELNLLDGVTVTLADITSTAAELNLLDGVTATTAEINYLSGVTSAIQTQIDNIPQPPELTQVQVEDDTSTVFGQVSGERLAQATASTLNASGSAPVYACRAWVNFNGTGTVAIRASGNVSSITDNGIGDYTVNFTTAIEDANYVITSSSPLASDGTKGGVGIRGGYNTAALLKTTSQFRIYSGAANTTGFFADFQQIDIAVFR